MNEVRKSQKSAAHRIASILEDAEFVAHVADTFGLPVVANRRAGLWYVPPALKAAEAYFKSTDGHMHEWRFSLKRLNLHLLPLIRNAGGAIIVDTTRRGKRMPDALAKTVPLWCAVLNLAVLGIDLAVFPPQCVGRSEQDQIRARVAPYAAEFRASVPPALWEQLTSAMTRPLRPLFVTPDAPLSDDTTDIFPGHDVLVLVTASRVAQDGAQTARGFTYVQGAADDHELWAPPRLGPAMLWHEANGALREPGLGDDELARRVAAAVDPAEESAEAVQVSAAPLFLGLPPNGETLIDLRGLKTDKRGAKELGKALPAVCTQFEASDGPVYLVSAGGTDYAHGAALMLDCRYFDESGQRREARRWVSKEDVTRRNAYLIAQTGIPPSRATQNAVGHFLRSK